MNSEHDKNTVKHPIPAPEYRAQALSQWGVRGIMTPPNEIDSGLRSRPLCARALCHVA